MTENELYNELQKAITLDINGKPDLLLLDIDDSQIAYVVRKCAKHILDKYNNLIGTSDQLERLRMEYRKMENCLLTLKDTSGASDIKLIEQTLQDNTKGDL